MKKRKQIHLKIIHKISIGYIIAIIFPILTITSIAYFQFFEREKATILDAQNSVIRQCEENLNTSLDVIESIGRNISNEPRLINYLSNGILGTSYSKKEYQYSISPIFEYSRLIQKVNVHSTRVFIHNTSIEVSDDTFFHDSYLLTTFWYSDFLNNSTDSMWIGPHSVDFFIGENNDKRKVYSYCQKLYNSKEDYVGMLVINIYQDELFSDFVKFYGDNSNFYAFNKLGQTLYTNSNKIFQLSQSDISSIIENSRYVYTERGNVYTLQNIPRMNIMLGIISDLENPLFLSKGTIGLLIVFLIILGFILIMFYFYIRNIFEKINEKIYQVNDIIHNNFNAEIQVTRNDEIGEISKSFNILIKKINLLIKDIVQKETAQKDAKLEALQYQINPHFIYNTLEIFSTKMELAGEYETSDALASFGKILRYNLNSESIFTNLLGEIEHVKSYIKIEQIKYGDRLNLEVNYPESLAQTKMIKFILQPIVENSISHGFKSMKGQMIITINVYVDRDAIHFQIIDNGNGIEPSRLKVLNDIFRTSNYSHPELATNTNSGIGLRNINERLKLFYNQKSFISISALNKETIIEFQIPLHNL